MAQQIEVVKHEPHLWGLLKMLAVWLQHTA